MQHFHLRFIKADPSGNTTIFILDPVDRSLYPKIAAEVMKDRSLCAEQVGFYEKARDPKAAAHMEMMGGEFCGNASRSFAAFLAMSPDHDLRLELLNKEEQLVQIEVSGTTGTLTAEVEDLGKPDECFASIEMPVPLWISHGKDPELGDYSLVGFEGICHTVLWNREKDPEMIGTVERFLRAGGIGDECYGVMFYQENTSRMDPVVIVKSVGSVVWESSCGSGSVSVASAIADRRKETVKGLLIHQPGGDLSVSAVYDGGVAEARLAGTVRFPAMGFVNVEL